MMNFRNLWIYTESLKMINNIDNCLETINKQQFFIQDDISLDKYFADADYVFHFAALADIIPSISDPIKYHRANVDGTIRVLEASKKSTKLKKFI